MCIYWIYRFKTKRNEGNWILKKLLIQFSTVSIKLLTLSQKCTLAMFLQSDLVCLIIKSFFLFVFSFSNKKGREDISILENFSARLAFNRSWTFLHYIICTSPFVSILHFNIHLHLIRLDINLTIHSWNFQDFQRIHLMWK